MAPTHTTTAYFFNKHDNQNPVNGVPGLVGFCVYTNGVVQTAEATPDNWKEDWNAGNVSFVQAAATRRTSRSTGDRHRDRHRDVRRVVEHGVPILLHIADAETCQDLYGGDATTCYVLPKPGPYCDTITGNEDAGYNAIPDQVEEVQPAELRLRGELRKRVRRRGDARHDRLRRSSNVQSMTVDFQELRMQ